MSQLSRYATCENQAPKHQPLLAGFRFPAVLGLLPVFGDINLLDVKTSFDSWNSGMKRTSEDSLGMPSNRQRIQASEEPPHGCHHFTQLAEVPWDAQKWGTLLAV